MSFSKVSFTLCTLTLIKLTPWPPPPQRIRLKDLPTPLRNNSIHFRLAPPSSNWPLMTPELCHRQGSGRSPEGVVQICPPVGSHWVHRAGQQCSGCGGTKQQRPWPLWRRSKKLESGWRAAQHLFHWVNILFLLREQTPVCCRGWGLWPGLGMPVC